ncbi:MAG: hypothetical protein ABI934_02890, partial [Actinomycetota bacterium]
MQGDRSDQGDGHLEAMLSGQQVPASVDEELRGVSELLATLRSGPSGQVERAGQARAMAAFRETFAGFQPDQAPRRRAVLRRTALGGKVGVALTAAAISFGAVGAAAYTGVLPSGLQNFAHASIGAPAADDRGNAEGTKIPAKGSKSPAERTKAPTHRTSSPAVGPDAAGGPAAFGLCTAWSHVRAEGQVADHSIAFRNLATAARGVEKIAAYCAAVPNPGVTESGKPAVHPAGKPANPPAGKPAVPPAGKPAVPP